MTQLVEVQRFRTTPWAEFDYAAAKAEVDDADARGDVVAVEGSDIVIRTRVYVRPRRSA